MDLLGRMQTGPSEQFNNTQQAIRHSLTGPDAAMFSLDIVVTKRTERMIDFYTVNDEHLKAPRA